MASSGTPVEIRGFKGLNVREDPGAIADNELTVCTNMELGRAGELIKRTGLEQLHAGTTFGGNKVTMLGHFLTDVYSQLIATNGTSLFYSSDGITWTQFPGTETVANVWGVQYGSKFYIVRSNGTVLEWTGAALAALAGTPPGTYGYVFKDRLFVLNTVATGSLNSRLYFSSIGAFNTFPSTNFIDVRAGDGDFLTSIGTLQDVLFLFKGRSIWGLYVQGSPTDWSLRNLNDEIGCISKYAIRNSEGFVYFSSSKAIYRTDGTTFEDISSPINTVLQNRIVNLTTANIDSFALTEDRLICHLAPTPSVSLYYVFYLKVGGWTKWEWATGHLPTTFLEVRTATPAAGIYCGTINSNGRVYRFGLANYNDIGNAYTCTIVTKDFDFDTPTAMKRGKWLGVDMIGQTTVNFTNNADGAVGVTNVLTSYLRRGLLKAMGPGYFRTWQLSMTFTNTVKTTIFGFTLQMAPKRGVIKAYT